MSEARIELRCVFSGRVQGVGFRWRTLEALRGLDLAGYVRNMADGRVELRVQGSRRDCEEAVARVHRTLGKLITATSTEQAPVTEPLGSFHIRR